MRLTARVIGTVLIVALAADADSAWAELPIEVEVATQKNVPLTAPQEWAQLLGSLDLERVRLRRGFADEKPKVTKVDGAGELRFKVVALLNHSGELVLPDRRFRASDRKVLRDYFQALARNESYGEELGGFGLTERQFRQVYADLSRPVGSSTTGKTPADVVALVQGKFELPLVLDAAVSERLQLAAQLEVELRDMTAGTALALALRNAGLILRPDKPTGEPLQLVIEQIRPDVDGWPVGWNPDGSPRQAAPKMFEFLAIEVDGYTLAKALDAIQPRLGIAMIYDERILAERKIDPAEIEVKLPAGRTYLKKVVDRLLSQARLAGELRVDEGGRAFYWITQFGRDSRRAE